MRASLVFRYRTVRNGVTVEMVIWALPRPSAERPHGLKYRLYCGRGDRCLVRYDNETGKGDHRHYGDREESYRFDRSTSCWKIFAKMAPAWRDGDGDEPDRDRSVEFPGGARRLYACVAADAREAQNDPAARLRQHRGVVQRGIGKAAGAGSPCRRRRGAA